jgi:predicted  nucleic acid-binding Zn-ribbon protein
VSKKLFPTDIFEQGKSALSAWGQIDDQMAFGPLNIGAFTMAVNRSRAIEENLTDLENRLTDLRNQRDAAHQDLWDKVKRLRAGVKAIFGDDSSQYEVVGGTRMSERKSAARKTPTPA